MSSTQHRGDRSPPPPRHFNRTPPHGVHPSRVVNFDPSRPDQPSSHPARDVPRAPKSFADSNPPSGPSRPSFPPRGRGFPVGRGDHRSDFRDRDPPRLPRDRSPPPPALDRDRDRPYRERDFDRRDKRSSPPPRRFDFRDGPSPRDSEFGRARPGPIPTYHSPDSARPPFSSFRDDHSRGRGRADWVPRAGRGRGAFYDDRPSTYRGRSRSPRAFRYDRDFRDERSFDDKQFDRKNSDRAPDHDDGPREPERLRREPPTPSFPQSRSSLHAPVSATHAPQAPSTNRATSNQERDHGQPRRVSSGNSTGGDHETKPEPSRPDHFNRRPDNQPDRFSSRPSSPPRAPEIPAFGSVPSNQEKSSQAPRWNIWTAPKEPKAMSQARPVSQQSVTSDVTSSKGSAPANVEAKGETHSSSSIAPKSEVQLDRPHTPDSNAPTTKSIPSSTASGPRTPTSVPAPGLPTQPREPTFPMKSPPTGPRQMAGVPTGPKREPSLVRHSAQMTSSQNLSGTPPGMASPGFAGSLGPRASSYFASPQASNTGVPTGPKAERFGQQPLRPPLVRGASLGRRGHSVERHNPPYVQLGLIPFKRDAEGEKKVLTSQEEGPTNAVGDHARTDGKDEDNSSRQPGQGKKEDSQSQLLQEPKAVRRSDRSRSRLRQLESSPAPGAISDDDAMDLDDDDFAINEDKFERDKSVLEAKKIDLTTRYLRGSTPLENLEFLGRLALEDFSRFFPPRTAAQDPRTAVADSELQQNVSAETETPAAAPEDAMEMQVVLVEERVTPSPISSPQIKKLPFLKSEPLTPVSDLEILQDSAGRHAAINENLLRHFEDRFSLRSQHEQELRREYARHYRRWRKDVEELNRQQEKEENENQEAIDSSAPPPEIQMSPTVSSATDPRRKRFVSEYDMEKVLQASMESEREAQAKRERESVAARPDFDKEAIVPDMLTDDDDFHARQFIDVNQQKTSAEAVAFWEFVPKRDDFSKDEHDAFALNFNQFPKKFGKLAQGLPGRTYKDCINHYYATKWNHQFKAPKDKRRRQMKGGPRMRPPSGIQGRPKANALISNLGELKPDVYDGDESRAPVVAVTDSGRPKRAAAPIFREKEVDGQENAATPGRKGRQDPGAEPNAAGEKMGRKSRGPPKEKTKRGKATQQLTMRQPSASPEKAPAVLPNKGGMEMNFDPDLRAKEIEVAGGLAQLQAGPKVMPAAPIVNTPQTVAPEISAGPPPPSSLPETLSRPQQNPTTKTGPSSYWSVQEVNMFPKLLEHYGTDWQSIANSIKTKSHTMVKNRYLRMAKDKPELEEMAHKGNERRERGEAPAPIAAPNLAAGSSSSSGNRRKNEPIQPAAPRALAPSTEIVEIEDDSSPSRNRSRSRSIKNSAKLQPAAPPSMHSQPPHAAPIREAMAPNSPPAVVSSVGPFPQTHRHREERVFYSQPVNASAEHGPTSRPSERIRYVAEMPPQGHSYQSGMGQPTFENLFRPSGSHRQSMGQSLERGPHRESPPQPFQQPHMGPRQPPHNVSMESRPHEGPSFAPAPPPTDPSQRPIRTAEIIERQPPPRSQSTAFYDPLRQIHHSPLVKDEPRAPSRSIVNPVAPQPPSKPEPRKTSNILSILNPTPDEPKDPPSRSFVSPAATPGRTRSPPQIASYQPSVYAAPRAPSRSELHDPVREVAPPAHQSYPPPSYASHQGLVRQSTDIVPRDGSAEQPLGSHAFRIDWPPRGGMLPPHQMDRPQPADRPDRHAETAQPGNYNHRSALQPLQMRVNPSPPPATYTASGPPHHSEPHSRRSSVSQYHPQSHEHQRLHQQQQQPPALSPSQSSSVRHQPQTAVQYAPHRHHHNHSQSHTAQPQLQPQPQPAPQSSRHHHGSSTAPTQGQGPPQGYAPVGRAANAPPMSLPSQPPSNAPYGNQYAAPSQRSVAGVRPPSISQTPASGGPGHIPSMHRHHSGHQYNLSEGSGPGRMTPGPPHSTIRTDTREERERERWNRSVGGPRDVERERERGRPLYGPPPRQ